jgi:hypothetical protein
VSIFETEIEIEIDECCSTPSISIPISVVNFVHEIDKASSTLHEIEIEIDKLINIKCVRSKQPRVQRRHHSNGDIISAPQVHSLD